jgi:hypothetical protein
MHTPSTADKERKTMPRRDRTFTSADCIRFWLKNLDRGERIRVTLFFHFFTKNIALEYINNRFSLLPRLLILALGGRLASYVTQKVLFDLVGEPLARTVIEAFPKEDQKIIVEFLQSRSIFR